MVAAVRERPPVAALLGELIPGAAGRIQRILESIRVHLGMDVAFASEFADGRRVFRHISAGERGSPIKVGGSDPLEDSYCQRVIDGRLPEFIRDAAQVPEVASLPATAALPVGAHLSVPLRLSDGRLYGTFCCFSFSPDPSLTGRDLATLRAFAHLAAEEVETQLRDEEERLATADTVQRIIAERALTMVYQPIYDLESGAVGVEALARFRDYETSSPADWFERAHRVGLGIELELTAARLALAGLPYLPRDFTVAINFAPETILSGRIPALLADIPPGRVVIEVTEHAVIRDYHAFADALAPLRQRALVAVDDVGAGYSGLRHILDLKPDLIKLDMSLVRNIHQDPARRALALALVAFASGIDSLVVAEGVENGAELNALRELGIRRAQGYHLSRPLPLMAVQQFVQGEGRDAPLPRPQRVAQRKPRRG